VHNEPSRLRLASAKRRIAAFLEQIAELKASSFPHDDGKEALVVIERTFRVQEKRLDIPVGASDDLIDATCVHLADLLSTYTDILGIILRSTNVRNPFELHFALAKLVKSTIGDDIRVLISSEWNFVPFTYPMSLDVLPNFVLIGSPAPESGNVLIAPLAGHEIGHTAWRSYDYATVLSPLVTDQVRVALNNNKKIETNLLNKLGLNPLGLNVIVDRCGGHALRQLEEAFCDLFGLYLFGSGYLFAFDYFLAPGASNCFLDYPPDIRRMEILVEAAHEVRLTVDEALAKRWQKANYDNEDSDMAVIVSAVLDVVVADMRRMLFSELERRNIFPPDDSVIAKVLSSFQRYEPFSEKATLAEIVTAGWRYLRDKKNLVEAKSQNKLKALRGEYKVLQDLMLKSIEVAEYLERLSESA